MKLKILANASLRKRQRTKVPIEQRLLDNLYKNPENGCWEWLGFKMESGHGKIGFRDKVFLVHRVSYEIHNGIIPKGKFVLHKCDNGKCFNPRHLFLGTQADNMRDAAKKGRIFNIPRMPGEKNPIASLTNKQASKIRKRLNAGERGVDLAKEFKVSKYVISKIKLGKTYRM